MSDQGATASVLAGVPAQVAAVIQLLGPDGGGKAIAAQRDAPRQQRPVVVVAGEDKRGKSSLVNALLAQPDLSPVGAKVVTGSPITFFWSAQPTAEILRYGSDQPEVVEVEAARTLATVDGNPGNQENIARVRIGLDIPILRSLTLIDTPGVGGLASGHATLTLQTLNLADALLFAVDAGTPLRASELTFLRRAAQRLQTVLLVLTKTDVNPHWQTIATDDAALLVEQAPRFAGSPIIPVSAGNAVRALRAGDPDFAAEIRTESGIAALEDRLVNHVAESVDGVRAQNLLRSTITALAVVERGLSERKAAAAPDGKAMAAMKAERARLKDLRRQQTDWIPRLDGEIRKLILERNDSCARRALALRNRYDDAAQDAKRSEFAELPGEVLADLTALAGELNEEAARRLAEILSSVIDDLDQSGLKDNIDQIAGITVADQLLPFDPGKRRLEHGERMELLSELGRGHSLMSLAAGTSALAFLAPPFGIVLGIGLGGAFAFSAWRAHGQRAQLSDFRTWLGQQVTNAQLTITNTFAAQMVDVQAEMRTAVRDALGRREDELTATIDKAETLARADADRHRQITADLDRRITGARHLREASARMLRALTPGTTS